MKHTDKAFVTMDSGYVVVITPWEKAHVFRKTFFADRGEPEDCSTNQAKVVASKEVAWLNGVSRAGVLKEER